jgi:DNA-binding NtrC family response regulator
MARITVVNDYPEFVELMTGILDEMAGHEVTGFDASEATVDELAETRPDLLIVDLQTAGWVLAGIVAAVGERLAAAFDRVPVIVCSGDIPALRERGDEFADLGNVYTLEKPFTLDMLTDLVERALYKTALSPVA